MTLPRESGSPPQKRTIQAPQADVLPGTAVSVELAEDEEVQWQWSHGPDGQSRITGYQIKKRASQK